MQAQQNGGATDSVADAAHALSIEEAEQPLPSFEHEIDYPSVLNKVCSEHGLCTLGMGQISAVQALRVGLCNRAQTGCSN
jgi:hypothetical protein